MRDDEGNSGSVSDRMPTDRHGDFSDLAQLLSVAHADTARESQRRSDPAVIAASGRRRKRRRILAAVTTLAVAALIGTYSTLVLTAPLGDASLAVRDVSVEPRAPVVLAVPIGVVSAVSVAGAEEFEGTAGVDGILASGGGNEPRPIASIAKLIAAMVILDDKPLAPGDEGPAIAFSEADEDLYDRYYVLGATVQPLEGGSTMGLRDALEVMLIPSATNYAHAVARWAFGSTDGFRRAAADWLAANGFTGTTIMEPTGMDPGNRSTPTDLIAIGRLAMQNPVLAEIVGMPSLDVPGMDRVSNTNSIVGEGGITGLKTGTLDEAGSCLLFSATFGVGLDSPISVVGVVLGSLTRQSANTEVQRLLGSIKGGFQFVTAIGKGDSFGTFTTPWGAESEVVAKSAAGLLTWSDSPITVDFTISTLSLGNAGEKVGTATFESGADTKTIDLVLESAIEEPDAWWRLTHPADVFG